MADALCACRQGVDALRHMLPTRFNWPLFLFASLLMAAPILRRRRQPIRACAKTKTEAEARS
jgi:hypothetical protein